MKQAVVMAFHAALALDLAPPNGHEVLVVIPNRLVVWLQERRAEEEAESRAQAVAAAERRRQKKAEQMAVRKAKEKADQERRARRYPRNHGQLKGTALPAAPPPAAADAEAGSWADVSSTQQHTMPTILADSSESHDDL